MLQVLMSKCPPCIEILNYAETFFVKHHLQSNLTNATPTVQIDIMVCGHIMFKGALSVEGECDTEHVHELYTQSVCQIFYPSVSRENIMRKLVLSQQLKQLKYHIETFKIKMIIIVIPKSNIIIILVPKTNNQLLFFQETEPCTYLLKTAEMALFRETIFNG